MTNFKHTGILLAAFLILNIIVDYYDGKYQSVYFIGVAISFVIFSFIAWVNEKSYGNKQVALVAMWACIFNLFDELLFNPTATGVNDYICLAILVVVSLYRYKKYKQNGNIR